MAKVSFKRVESINDLNSIDIEDGNFIITGDSNAFIDYGSKRIPIGGTPDNQMDDSSTNSVQNKIIKKYIDDKTSTNSKNIEELKESNIYSTEEKIVGKWIDGKPIYRKVIEINSGLVSGENTINFSNISNLKEIVNINGNTKIQDSNRNMFWTPLCVYHPSDNNWRLSIMRINNNSMTYFIGAKYFETVQKILSLRLILEYTKTTDEVVE